MASPNTAETYTRSEVRRILKISENRLRSWERLDLCERRSEFGFADLIALKTLQKLRERRIPATRIKSSLASLSKKLAGIKRPLWDLKIVSDGKRVAVELPGGKMEALTGQMLFDFDASSLKPVTELSNRAGAAADRTRQAEDWFRRGLELEETGSDVQEAIAAYRKAVELNPDAAGAWVNIGTLLYQQRELEEAERCYRQALEASPGYALAHFNLGNICEESERLPEAVNHYRLALRMQPEYADAHYNIALVYERAGEPMRAAKHWRSYLNLDSTSPWALIARRQLEGILEVTAGGPSRVRRGELALPGIGQ